MVITALAFSVAAAAVPRAPVARAIARAQIMKPVALRRNGALTLPDDMTVTFRRRRACEAGRDCAMIVYDLP